MNKMSRAVATAALATSVVALAAGNASAAPTSAPAPAAPSSPATTSDLSTLSTDILPGVHYTSNMTDRSVVITSPLGSLTTQGSQFQVQDTAGHTVAGAPFATAPKAAAPQTSQVVGPAAAAPAKPGGPVKPAGAVAAPLKNVDWQSDFNADLGVAATQFGLATGIGSMVGGLVGVALGCPIGAVTAGITGLPTGPVDPLLALIGCAAGAAVLGSTGPIVGGALLGIPVGIASAVQMYNTMHAAGEVAAPMPAHS